MRRIWLCLCFAIAPLLLIPRYSASQTAMLCEHADSAAVDTMLAYAGAYHAFGENTTTWPHEFDVNANDDFKAFRQVFRLYLTNHVSGRFSTPEWEDILHAIMNNDTTGTRDDVFAHVWDYFTRQEADSNTAYAGVRFRYYAITDHYTYINIYLHDTADLAQPYSTAGGNAVWVNASSNESLTFILGAIGHELQHLCFGANGAIVQSVYGPYWQFPVGYRGINETLSTLAEYVLDMWHPIAPYNLAYDASFMDSEPCDVPQAGTTQSPKYNVYKPWMIYLYEIGNENAADPTDDLLYRWIRNNAVITERLLLDTLADLLWSDSSYDWLEGTDATDRLNRLYANFLAAKFCNAPDFSNYGEFAIAPAPFNTVTNLGFFTDNDGCGPTIPPGSGYYPDSPVDCPIYEDPNTNWCWTVRVLLPTYELDGGNEGATTTQAHHFYAADTSVDSIDVYNYGTDYVVFRAGSYFQDSEEHELRLRVRGRPIASGATNGIKPVGWVMGYSSNDDTLQVHPEHLLFVEPLAFTPTTTTADSSFSRTVIVADFGRSVKAVVLAVGSAGLRPDLNGYPTNGFTYGYEFAVFTPGATTRTWDGDVFATGDITVPDGGTLNIAAGTRVKIYPSDLVLTGADPGLVELNIEGTLVADGTASDPIVFEPWISDPLSALLPPSWVGIYIDSLSDGCALDHCRIVGAETAIESWAPLTVTNSDIESCSYAGVIAKAGGALIEECAVTNPGYVGVAVESGGLTVRDSSVESAILYGVLARANTTLTVRNSAAQQCGTGLYVEGNSSANVDSTCYFYANGTGVHLYGAGSAATIRGSGITHNTSTAIVCDNSSHPLIEANIFANNGGGIYCSNNSSPTIAANAIQSSGNAVTAASGANPDIGHYPSSGNNQIAHTTRYVVNYTGSTVFAQNNCWDNEVVPCRPPTNMFVGDVNRTNPICCAFPPFGGGEGAPPGFAFQPEPTKTNATGLVAIVPNPFNPTTTIHYSLASQSDVTINIYDVAGRLVEELTRGSQPAGPHSAVWNGTDRRGSPVASGVYFVRMASAGQVFTRKMLLLK